MGIPELDVLTALMLFATGLIAGVCNAVAGGGGYVARMMSAVMLKRVVIGVGVLLTAYYFHRYYGPSA